MTDTTVKLIQMTVSELLREDKEIGEDLDSVLKFQEDEAERNRMARYYLRLRRECRDELNRRHDTENACYPSGYPRNAGAFSEFGREGR